MAWFFRKSFRLLSGVRINLSKSGPRLSVGVPGARASIDMEGKTRLYGGMGPVGGHPCQQLRGLLHNGVAGVPMGGSSA
jgi:hypothetical protein